MKNLWYKILKAFALFLTVETALALSLVILVDTPYPLLFLVAVIVVSVLALVLMRQRAAKKAEEQEIEDTTSAIAQVQKNLDQLVLEKKELEEELELLSKEAICAMTSIDAYENLKSDEVKNQLAILKTKEEALIKNDKALTVSSYENKKTVANRKKQIDVHALIFSEDAPALETLLHHHFQLKQVNKVNPRKEFFRVELNEIKELVLKNLNATVQFVDIPDAEQYRQTLKIEEGVA